MRLLKVELKRILKTRLTIILLSAALLLTFFMAWLPITFPYNSYTYTDTQGKKVELKGLESIAYYKQLQADITGSVTPEMVRQAVEDYQACLKKYGAEASYDLPEGVYEAEIMPYAPLLHGIREAFANPDTGIAPSILEIDPEKVDDYYDLCAERVVTLMRQEQKNHPAAQQVAIDLYSQVKKPYLYYPRYSSEVLEYQIFLAFLVLLLCTVITAPVFTSDYQTGADDIYRCTKYGKTKFACIKILSAFIICGTAYCLSAAVFLLISNSLWGWECTKTSMQILFSIISLGDMNVGQLQLFIAAAGLLSLLAVISLTAFFSSRFKTMTPCLATALLFCILPIIIYITLPKEIGIWLYSILPASATSLQTAILYAAADFDFWNIGNIAIWLPHVMLGAAVIEIPLFAGLAVYSYVRYRIN
ncbi:MAG: ABC transporter permease subunit [Lachnospiraceae bacterium]|nr:ABC transporter permease subunit [Lachnospiraceae bacterium]